MTLVSIPSNPAPEDVVSSTIKTPDGAELRFRESERGCAARILGTADGVHVEDEAIGVGVG